MDLGLWTGVALVLAGGVLQGVFAVPMKYAREWRHENIWLVFAATGLVVFPWLLTAATVGPLGEVYHATSWRALGAIVLFGACWGIGATFTGIGLRMLGISLGLAVILGLSASVGSMVPLLALTPEKLFTGQGGYYLLGTAVMLAGIALAAIAGSLRERGASGGALAAGGSYLAGLAVCILAGILSSMLNFCYAFGAEATESARRLGVPELWASNVVAAPATTGGFVANLVYCAFAMRRHGTASLFWRPGTRAYWLFGAMMGGFWFGGLAVYGTGIYRLGDFGPVAGWPLLMGTIIVSSNAAGVLTGEWRGVGPKAMRYLYGGIAVILAALALLAAGQGQRG